MGSVWPRFYYKIIPCHLIAAKLGTEASWGLLLMHAIYQDVILFQTSMELESEHLGRFGAVCLI